MKLASTLLRWEKLAYAVAQRHTATALIRHGVLAAAEHRAILSLGFSTIVDIGANRGQFALAARRWCPGARLICFEPLPGPATVFRSVFQDDTVVTLHQCAIGPSSRQQAMHVAARDDSSSLLPISSLQEEEFPGTHERGLASVSVAPLRDFVSAEDLTGSSLLKLDVQGYEYEALLGCEDLLSHVQCVYCECSFVEFYTGQKLLPDIVRWLAARGFHLCGVYNTAYGMGGRALQADFAFSTRANSDG